MGSTGLYLAKFCLGQPGGPNHRRTPLFFKCTLEYILRTRGLQGAVKFKSYGFRPLLLVA